MRIRYFHIAICTVFALFAAGFVLAHGTVAPNDETLYPPAQIGSPESRVGHHNGAGVSHPGDENGLSRSQIAGLSHKIQDEENFRSGVRLSFLVLFIFGLIMLFYPKKPIAFAAQVGNVSDGLQPDVASLTSKPAL